MTLLTASITFNLAILLFNLRVKNGNCSLLCSPLIKGLLWRGFLFFSFSPPMRNFVSQQSPRRKKKNCCRVSRNECEGHGRRDEYALFEETPTSDGDWCGGGIFDSSSASPPRLLFLFLPPANMSRRKISASTRGDLYKMHWMPLLESRISAQTCTQDLKSDRPRYDPGHRRMDGIWCKPLNSGLQSAPSPDVSWRLNRGGWTAATQPQRGGASGASRSRAVSAGRSCKLTRDAWAVRHGENK